jgi:hypothetical protein
VQIPLGAWVFSEWVVQGGEKRLGGGLVRLGMTPLAPFHLNINPLTQIYKNYIFDLTIKIVVLTDFDSRWTNT